jgi:hypothetical protein
MTTNLDPKRVSLSKLGRKLLQLAAFALFALGNPLYLVACSSASDGDDNGNGNGAYRYGRDDMVAVASGLEAEGPFEVGGYKVSVQLPFDGRTAGDTASSEDATRGSSSSSRLAPSYLACAHACGTRSFVAPAAACIDSSELQLQAMLRIEHGEEAVEVEVTGNMRVASLNLTFADFDFTADALQLSFAWHQDEGYRYEPRGGADVAALAALFAR